VLAVLTPPLGAYAVVLDTPMSLGLPRWSAAVWQALGIWAAVIVAVVAAVIGLRQYRATAEANRLQADASRSQIEAAKALAYEESRPYVVAYLEPLDRDPRFIYLVVKNFGRTPATYVTLTVDPPPQSSGRGGQPEDVRLPDSWPFLAPGQEWRTMWDFSPNRSQTQLPRRHRAVVRAKGAEAKGSYETVSHLDWDMMADRRWVGSRTVHDVAESLVKMEKTVAAMQQSMALWTDQHRGLVVSLSEDEKDA
jgi:hypothetical protein